MSHGDNRRVRLEVGDYTSGGNYSEEEEQGFTFTASVTMEVMDTNVDDAKAWFENYLATQGNRIDFDIEEV